MNKSNKLVIINRAIPGGGKTSLTKEIEKRAKDLWYSISIHSTDEYFIQIDERVSGVMFLIKRNSMNTTKTIKKPSNKL
ncbi:hypothetical protein ACLGC3_06155 [Helicobacter pylori]